MKQTIRLIILILIYSFFNFNTGYCQTYKEFLSTQKPSEKQELAYILSTEYAISNIDSLQIIGNTLLHFSVKSRDKEGIYLSYFILGQYFTKTTQELRGIDLLIQAKRFYASTHDFRRLTEVITLIGNAYQSLGKIDKSIKWYNQSLRYGERTSDEVLENTALINLAQAQMKLKQFKEAKKSANKYKDIVLKAGKKNAISNSFAVLGTIAMAEEDYQSAVAYYEQSYYFAEQINENSMKANAYTNIGIAKFILEEYAVSKDYFKKALDMRIKTGNIKSICDGYLNYGGILFELKEVDEAIQYYKIGLKEAQQHNKPTHELELLTALKEAYSLIDTSKVSSIDQQISLANRKVLKEEKRLEKLDLYLTGEIQRSFQVRSNGFKNPNTRKYFYAGAGLLFCLALIFVVKKRM